MAHRVLLPFLPFLGGCTAGDSISLRVFLVFLALFLVADLVINDTEGGNVTSTFPCKGDADAIFCRVQALILVPKDGDTLALGFVRIAL